MKQHKWNAGKLKSHLAAFMAVALMLGVFSGGQLAFATEIYAETDDSAATPAAQSIVNQNTDLALVFDPDDILVTDSYRHTIPLSESTNINSSIDGNVITVYDADSTATPTSYYAGNTWWQAESLVLSRQEVSLRSSWTMKYNLTTPPVDMTQGSGYAGAMGVVRLNLSDSLIVEISARNAGGYNQTSNSAIYIYDDQSGNTTAVIGDQTFFDNGAPVTVHCDYDGSNVTLSVSAGSETVTRTYAASSLNTKASMWFGGNVTWQGGKNTAAAQKKYPVSTLKAEFVSFSYDNLSPVIEAMRWFKKDGTELAEGDIVNPGETLDVEVDVRNDALNDIIPATLYLSDDATQAETKGVAGESDILDGMYVELENEIQTLRFTVTVTDSIGNISLGVMLEDEFFHNKAYAEVSAAVDVGKLFTDGTPVYTVQELARDSEGNIITDSEGQPTFVDSADQDTLNQDSYIKAVINLENPRAQEDLTINLKADIADAAGLDLENLYGVTIEAGGQTISADQISKLFDGQGLDIVLKGSEVDADGTESVGCITLVIPVKQNDDGTPFSTDAQNIHYTASGSFVAEGTGQLISGAWERDKETQTITDIDTVLSTTNITLEREESFDLLDGNTLSFEAAEASVNAEVKPEDVSIAFDESDPYLEYFGISDATGSTGTVQAYADDGTKITATVTYNGVIYLNGQKHYTRKGSSANPPAREKEALVELEVQGGLVIPSAYLEIPSTVMLNDNSGIDSEHAGIMAEVKVKNADLTSHTFDITADNNFEITGTNNTAYTHTVTLYDASGNAFPASGSDSSKADIGEIGGTATGADSEVSVWYNLVKDPSRDQDIYEGTMLFYITMN